MKSDEIKALIGTFFIDVGKKVQATRLPHYEIIVNAAKCLACGDIIESKHRHDFVKCTCGNLSVDGGFDYVKRSVTDCTKIVEMSVYKEEVE